MNFYCKAGSDCPWNQLITFKIYHKSTTKREKNRSQAVNMVRRAVCWKVIFIVFLFWLVRRNYKQFGKLYTVWPISLNGDICHWVFNACRRMQICLAPSSAISSSNSFWMPITKSVELPRVTIVIEGKWSDHDDWISSLNYGTFINISLRPVRVCF